MNRTSSFVGIEIINHAHNGFRIFGFAINRNTDGSVDTAGNRNGLLVVIGGSQSHHRGPVAVFRNIGSKDNGRLIAAVKAIPSLIAFCQKFASRLYKGFTVQKAFLVEGLHEFQIGLVIFGHVSKHNLAVFIHLETIIRAGGINAESVQ